MRLSIWSREIKGINSEQYETRTRHGSRKLPEILHHVMESNPGPLSPRPILHTITPKGYPDGITHHGSGIDSMTCPLFRIVRPRTLTS